MQSGVHAVGSLRSRLDVDRRPSLRSVARPPVGARRLSPDRDAHLGQVLVVDGHRIDRDVLDHSGRPAYQALLAAAHRAGRRPVCACADPPAEMVVRHLPSGRYVVARLPDGGAGHSPACASFTGPLASGGRDLYPKVTVLLEPSGALTVRLAEPLVDGGEAGPGASGGLRRGGSMSLLGLMHLLWEEAGLHRWTPAMTGKRGWWTVHCCVRELAEEVTIRPGRPLGQVLWVPERFHEDRVEAQHAAFRAWLAAATATASRDQRRWAVVLGEVKAIDAGDTEVSLSVRHLPRCRFTTAPSVWSDVVARYPRVRGLLPGVEVADEQRRPRARVVAALVCRPGRRVVEVANAALMAVSHAWIPVDSSLDLVVADRLVAERRAFVKPLRYDASASDVFPDFVLTDTAAPQLPLEVYGFTDDPVYEQRKRRKIAHYATTGVPFWHWDVGVHREPPPFPR